MKTTGHKNLLEFEGIYKSMMGGLIPGSHAVFRGKDVFAEFGNWSWMKMLFYCVSGKEPSPQAEAFLNGLYCMCYNYADPRIWNNRVAALAATSSSTAQLGVCAASAVSEAEIYGGPPVAQALEFLIKAKKAFDDGAEIKSIVDDELRENGIVYGFGRPVSKKDERIVPALNLLDDLKLIDRPYIQFALEIQKELLSRDSKTGFNIGGVMAGFCADEKLSADELYKLMVVCFYIGQLACYIDAESKPIGSFYPIRCDNISYQGSGFRDW